MIRIFCALFCFLFIKNYSHADELKIAGIPALSFDSDQGFGGGLVGSLYFQKENSKYYDKSLDALVFFTTKNVQSHYIKLDIKNAFNKNIRLTSKLGFFSSFSQNYCGEGNFGYCFDKEKDSKYYQYPLISLYGGIYSKFLIYKKDFNLDFILSYRGNQFWHRSFKEKNIYKESLFEKEYLDKKINGYLSTIESGFMIDKRDNEPAPTSGYWFESTIRGGSFLWASSWDYIGANASFRFYAPFDNAHRIVFASQSMIDIMEGKLPYEALSKIGGSQSLDLYSAFGGKYIGRGLRDQMISGKLKVLEQIELRYNFFAFSLLRQNFSLTASIFGDFGLIGQKFQTISKDLKNPLFGFGPGFRIHWNENFIIRADLGLSPNEKFSPRFYLVIGNVF